MNQESGMSPEAELGFSDGRKATRLKAELAVALEAVEQCCRVCRQIQKSIRPETLEKKDKSPVTIADYASQAVVGKLLSKRLSGETLVAEEGAELLRSPEYGPFLMRIGEELAAQGIHGSPEEIIDWIDQGSGTAGARFWTLDPIDGTKGFLRAEQYAISLALIVNGSVELGVLGLPNFPWGVCVHDLDSGQTTSSSGLGTLFYAVRGEGAFELSLTERGLAPYGLPLQVSQTSNSADARWVESVESGHSAHDVSSQIAARLGIHRPPVRMDSQAKYATVAMGMADVYLRMPTRADYREKIWDHAGGLAIVEAAGGRVSDIHGRPLDFTQGHELVQNQGVVVTNGLLHESVIEAIAAVQRDADRLS